MKPLIYYLLFIIVATSAQNTVKNPYGWSAFWDYALDLEGPAGHDHDTDPSLDGSCVACVGARRIYCLDGDENGENKSDLAFGSC